MGYNTKMLNIIFDRFRIHYQPLNRITLNESQLITNYNHLNNAIKEINITPVLKSNAYGHGLVHIAPIVDKLKPEFICVDSLAEANILKKLGIKSEILIMGTISEMSLQKKLPFQLTIVSLESLQMIIQTQKNAKVHIFIDTGMNREGVKIDELTEVLAQIKKSSLQLVGVMTHLAIAHDKNNTLTKTQIKNFIKAKKMVLDAELKPKYFHIGGSDAINWISPDIANIVRVGRLIYGIQAKRLKAIKPILQFQSTITQIKQITKGESIGYSATYTAQNDMTIALLPVGYNDGLDRRLSNKGVVFINAEACPILGLISMNMTVIDISNLSQKIKVGDQAVIFTSDDTKQNSIENSAKIIDTNPSDLLVGLHASTRREVR
jgi:alanine racemase